MNILELKQGVVDEGVCREVWFALGTMAAVYWQMFGRAMVVTSLKDGEHGAGSLHPAGRAADVRARDLTLEQRTAFHEACKKLLLEQGFDLVAEGPPWNERAPHEHCEFDPKAGREFEVREK